MDDAKNVPLLRHISFAQPTQPTTTRHRDRGNCKKKKRIRAKLILQPAALSLSPMSGSTASEAQPRRWHARENCHQSAWPVAPARSPPAPPLHGPSARGTRAHEPVDPPEPRVPASASQLRTLVVVQLVGIPSELRTCCKDIPELGLCEPAAPLDNQVFNRGQ